MEIRKAERDGYCRGCDEPFVKGQVIFSDYSWRNRGISIFYCLHCLAMIADMYDTVKDMEL